MVITFTVEEAEPGFHTCPGSDRVRYVIDLQEPIGDRVLVDGTCRTDADAQTGAFCEDTEVRWSAQDGIWQFGVP